MTIPSDRPTTNAMPGRLLIISGPSGSGKSTVIQAILREGEFPLAFSVSATSRKPRSGEIDGEHYYFLSREEFEKRVGEGAFLEWAEVYGNLYGTLREPVEQALAAGRWVVLDIDSQGHEQVKRLRPDAVSFFLRAPTIQHYEQRLRSRATDAPSAIERRLVEMERELARASRYDFQVVNETLDQAVRTLRTLLRGLTLGKEVSHAG